LASLESIEVLHNHNIIHRDIKPEVLSIDVKGGKKEIIIFLEFGFWKYFKNNNNHIPFKKYKKMIGQNLIYGSISALSGIELSRRDDLESLAYALIYFINGSLPWEGMKIKNKDEKIKEILEMKKKIKEDDLCCGLPDEIKLFVSYIKNLKFEEEPDYNYLKGLFISVLSRNELKNDLLFSWTINKKKVSKQEQQKEGYSKEKRKAFIKTRMDSKKRLYIQIKKSLEK
jgi:serine/threonine protein kinase